MTIQYVQTKYSILGLLDIFNHVHCSSTVQPESSESSARCSSVYKIVRFEAPIVMFVT